MPVVLVSAVCVLVHMGGVKIVPTEHRHWVLAPVVSRPCMGTL